MGQRQYSWCQAPNGGRGAHLREKTSWTDESDAETRAQMAWGHTESSDSKFGAS